MKPARAAAERSIKNAVVPRQNIIASDRPAPGGLRQKKANGSVKIFHERYGDAECMRLNNITLSAI